MGIVVGLHVYWALTRTTEQDVKDLIENNLSPNATTEEIFAFLDSRGIDHGEVQDAEFESVVLDAGYPANTKVVGAIIRGTSRTIFSSGDIEIFFILDSSGRMENYIVHESFTSF